MANLYEYLGVLWEYRSKQGRSWVIPICPIHKMELNYDYQPSSSGSCEECSKRYSWSPSNTDTAADYLRRKFNSTAYQEAEVISIDGIQTPQLKIKTKIPEDNNEYWIEARLNKSNKGRQLTIYVGEKGVQNKVQLFANLEDEKLSFDHKDRKPEEILTEVVVTFPSGKKMIIEAPKSLNTVLEKTELNSPPGIG